MASLRILTWNILHGGGPTRTPEIGLAILAHRPDVVVLTEFRAARGGQLRGQLADAGLTHQLASKPATGRNGILIAATTPVHGDDAAADFPMGKWLAGWLPAHGLAVHAVHVPDDTQATAKAAAWQFLLAHARDTRHARSIYIGDFNTARHGQDSPGRHFACERLLGAFCSLGFTEAWRRQNPATREDSWVSPLGSGRLDAAYLSSPLIGSLREARYLHNDREAGLSDHSPLLVAMEMEATSARKPETLFAGRIV